MNKDLIIQKSVDEAYYKITSIATIKAYISGGYSDLIINKDNINYVDEIISELFKKISNDVKTKVKKDDGFVKELYKKGCINRNASNDEKNEILIKVAKEMGYDFTLEEYKDANGVYFKKLGVWKTIKTLWHFSKVVKSAEKENK